MWARRDQRLGASGLIVLPSGGTLGASLAGPCPAAPRLCPGKGAHPHEAPWASAPWVQGVTPGVSWSDASVAVNDLSPPR